SPLCQYRGETKPVLSRQFRGFAEGQETLRIQSNGQFLAQALFGFRLWNAQTACNRIGNAECDVHRLFRLNDSKSESVDLALELVCSVRSKGLQVIVLLVHQTNDLKRTRGGTGRIQNITYISAVGNSG